MVLSVDILDAPRAVKTVLGVVVGKIRETPIGSRRNTVGTSRMAITATRHETTLYEFQEKSGEVVG